MIKRENMTDAEYIAALENETRQLTQKNKKLEETSQKLMKESQHLE